MSNPTQEEHAEARAATDVEALLGAAARSLREGDLDGARDACDRALALAPDDPDALRLQALFLIELGRAPLAALVLAPQLASRPADARLRVVHGRGLAAAGDEHAALESFDAAIAIDGDEPEAHLQRGIVLAALERSSEALGALERARELSPGSPEVAFWLANLAYWVGDASRAAALHERAVELDPGYQRRHLAVARTLARNGRVERARRVLECGIALEPGHPGIAHDLAQLGGGGAPTRTSDDYLRRHFDRFAESFDHVLVDVLSYRTPDRLVALLEPFLPEAPCDILDAGCGTGLCGPLLRSRARTLAGVDLSPAMLERAAARGVYDTLRDGELVADLAATPRAYDAIVAADVVLYFGDLDALLAAAAAALRPAGLLALSIELHDGPGWELRATGRYAHGADYLRETAIAAGFEPAAACECDLRTEGGKPVRGELAVFRRP